MTESNVLFDGTLVLTVGGHDFTAVLLPGLAFSNTNPGGFGDCTFRIAAASPFAAYVRSGHTMAKGDAVALTHGAVTLFEGVITNDVSHAVVEGGTACYEVTAAGLWWKAGLKKDFCRVWGDDDYEQWFTLEAVPKQFEVDLDGKVSIGVSVETPVKADSHGYIYYWLDNGMGDPAETIAAIFGNLFNDIQTSAGTFVARLQSSEDWATWYTEQTWTDTYCDAEAPWQRAITQCAAKVIRFDLYSTNRWVNLDEDVTLRLRKAGVCTSRTRVVPITAVATGTPSSVITSAAHGLKTGERIFIAGTDTSGEVDGWRTVTYVSSSQFSVPVVVTSVTDGVGTFYAAPRVDEAMADIAVTTNLATSSDLQTGGIGDINWGLNVRPHMSRAEAIEMFAGTHSEPIDYGFWDSGVFYCKERIAAAGVHDILIDSTLPGIDFNVFAATEESPAAVKVLYKFRDVDGGSSVYPDGTVLAVYRPSAPTWADASVQLDVWDQWVDLSLTTLQAQELGDQILAWIDDNQYVGDITISNPTVPLRGGGTRNSAYLRGGDYIEDTNLDTGPLQISSVDVDVDSGVVTLGIGETRAEFVRRTSRTLGQYRVEGHDGRHRHRHRHRARRRTA